MGYVVADVYSKHPLGVPIKAWMADNSYAKFELIILAVNLKVSSSIVVGIYILKSDFSGTNVCFVYDPMNPPED